MRAANSLASLSIINYRRGGTRSTVIALSRRVGLRERGSSNFNTSPSFFFAPSCSSIFFPCSSTSGFTLRLSLAASCGTDHRSVRSRSQRRGHTTMTMTLNREESRHRGEWKGKRKKERRARPDRLRCNWRAHYLVLSHRDNYLCGRFRAPDLV